MKELLEAGVHFGHQVRRWNPKMKDYIFGERNGIYIIDLQKTQRLFQEALGYVEELAGRGGNIMFVGTKRQAQEAIKEEAVRCGMPYVTERWLGGLLTNFVTDTRKEAIAVKEARKLKIPVVGVVDTNCDPDEVDYVIPANDDALRAIRLFAGRIADAVLAGHGMREAKNAEANAAADKGGA